MVSSALKKFAEPLGFENKNGRLFGDYQGYSVTLIEGMGYKSLMIGVTLTNDDPRVNQLVGFIENHRKESRIQNFNLHPSQITIQFEDKIGTMKRFTEFFEKIIAFLKEIGIPGNTVCWYCKNEFSGTSPEKVQVNDAVIPMHSGCIESYIQSIQNASEEFHSESKNYLKGTLGAFIGGIVGVIPWIIVYLLGYFVGWLGFLIGFTSKKGYEMLGGKPGRAKPWIILAIVIISVLLGQFVAINISIYNAFVDEGFTSISILDIPPFFFEAIQSDSDILLEVLGDVGLGLVFAFLGIYGLFKDLKHEAGGSLATVKRLG